MKKIILGGIVLLVLIAVALVAAFCLFRPQVIISKNGTKFTLVGVSYGKHHAFRGIKTAGTHLRGRATIDTTNDTLVVWIKSEHKGTQFQNDQLFVCDSANTACVSAWPGNSEQIKGGLVQGYTLNAFPRRDKEIILRIASWGNYGGMRAAKGQFVISNPGPRSFPNGNLTPCPIRNPTAI